MCKFIVLISITLSTLSFCNGQTVNAHCGNNITISVDGVDSFPVDVNNIDTRSNATGLVAGYTEYCDVDGGEPAAACKFTEDSNTNSLVIEDFNSCNISSKYITADNVTEITVLVSRIPYVNSTTIRRSECGRFAVICRYNSTLENVTYDTSVNVTTHDYVGVNATVNSTAEAQLYLINAQGLGSSPGVDTSDGTTYNLTEMIHVEARIVNNTDKYVSTLLNCYASKDTSFNDDYMLIGPDGCANLDDGTIQVDNGTTPTIPRYFPYFDVQSFVWTSLERTIFIQCDIEMCLENDSDCISSMTNCSPSKFINRFSRKYKNLKKNKIVTRSVISRAINVGNVNAVKNTFIGIKN